MITFCLLLCLGVICVVLAFLMTWVAFKFDCPPPFIAAIVFVALAIACAVHAVGEAKKLDEVSRATEVKR